MGLPPNMSDAHTINGKPGPLFPCSEKRKNNSLTLYYISLFLIISTFSYSQKMFIKRDYNYVNYKFSDLTYLGIWIPYCRKSTRFHIVFNLSRPFLIRRLWFNIEKETTKDLIRRIMIERSGMQYCVLQ
jgi:hypothetical protein